MNSKDLIALAISLAIPSFSFASQIFTNQDVLNAIQSSNLDSTKFPWTSDFDPNLNGKIKRWDITNPIGVKFNNVSSQRQLVVNEALDMLESSSGLILFDRTSLNSVDENSITRGLVVSYGTSYVPLNTSSQDLQNGFYQAGVSGALFQSGYPADFLQPDGTISSRLYINLGNNVITDPDTFVVAHEFAHALGLGEHFVGFGLDDVSQPNLDPELDGLAFSTLSTLYRNPIGTPLANITVYAVPEAGTASLFLGSVTACFWLRTRNRQGLSIS